MSPLLGKTAPRGCWTSFSTLSESPAASRLLGQRPFRLPEAPAPALPSSTRFPPPVSVVDMPRAERWSGEPPPTYAEVRPCADPNDAGTAWRAERLKDLAWRAKCLRVHDTPEIQEALAAMRASTAALDEMAVAQSSPTYERPGRRRIRRRRAEANDAGVAAPRQEVRRGVDARPRRSARVARAHTPTAPPPPSNSPATAARSKTRAQREGPTRHRDAPRRAAALALDDLDEALARRRRPR